LAKTNTLNEDTLAKFCNFRSNLAPY